MTEEGPTKGQLIGTIRNLRKELDEAKKASGADPIIGKWVAWVNDGDPEQFGDFLIYGDVIARGPGGDLIVMANNGAADIRERVLPYGKREKAWWFDTIDELGDWSDEWWERYWDKRLGRKR